MRCHSILAGPIFVHKPFVNRIVLFSCVQSLWQNRISIFSPVETEFQISWNGKGNFFKIENHWLYILFEKKIRLTPTTILWCNTPAKDKFISDHQNNWLQALLVTYFMAVAFAGSYVIQIYTVLVYHNGGLTCISDGCQIIKHSLFVLV